MRYEQFAEKTAQEYQKKGLAEGRSIPEIELYIDQMVSCLNSELSLYAKDGDGPITKGMISNYTKHKMIPGPEGKRYTKDHCIFMLLVYYLKGCFSMDQIQRLMKPLLSNYSSEWDDSLDIQAYYGKIIEEVRKAEENFATAAATTISPRSCCSSRRSSCGPTRNGSLRKNCWTNTSRTRKSSGPAQS